MANGTCTENYKTRQYYAHSCRECSRTPKPKEESITENSKEDSSTEVPKVGSKKNIFFEDTKVGSITEDPKKNHKERAVIQSPQEKPITEDIGSLKTQQSRGPRFITLKMNEKINTYICRSLLFQLFTLLHTLSFPKQKIRQRRSQL